MLLRRARGLRSLRRSRPLPAERREGVNPSRTRCGVASETGAGTTPGSEVGAGFTPARPGACSPLVRSLLLLLLSLGAFAQEGSFIDLRFGVYKQDDGGGNEWLDEDETIIEPIVLARWQIDESWGLNLGYYYDFVSSASIERLSETDGQSGASRDNYNGGYIGADYAWGENQIALTLSGSFEYDYMSTGVGLSYARWLNERQTRVRLSGQAFFDSVDVIRFDGSEEGSDDRTTFSLGLSLEHILTPTITVSGGYTFAYQSGFLESSINRVLVRSPFSLPTVPVGADRPFRGFEASEELPDTRLRNAFHARIDKYLDWEEFPDSSVGLGTRFYIDDWGIMAWDVEPRWRQWLVEETLMLELRYRFYTQSEADDYEEVFDSLTADRTSDPDLAAFVSNTLGTTLTWNITENMTFDLTFDVMVRDDDLNAYWGSIGWNFRF